jgi:hypothetical protein
MRASKAVEVERFREDLHRETKNRTLTEDTHIAAVGPTITIGMMATVIASATARITTDAMTSGLEHGADRRTAIAESRGNTQVMNEKDGVTQSLREDQVVEEMGLPNGLQLNSQ